MGGVRREIPFVAGVLSCFDVLAAYRYDFETGLRRTTVLSE